MRLEQYWGVGPKTSTRLQSELGAERAVEAIESGNVRALTDAGLDAGRARRICRRAAADEAMEVLATGDARTVYTELLELVRPHAVTRAAADRIRVLTPLDSLAATTDRLDRIEATREAWTGLSAETREAALAAFEEYDAAEGERAAVATALELRDLGLTSGPFAALEDLDASALRAATTALARLGADAAPAGAPSGDAPSGDGVPSEDVPPGVDERLDDRRETLAAVEALAEDSSTVLSAVLDDDVRDGEAFYEAFVEYVTAETGVEADRMRAVIPEGAADAAEFVDGALRALAADRRTAVDEREAAVAAGLRETVEDARDAIDDAVTAVDDVALYVSLARFAEAYDLTRPRYVADDDCVAVVGARNLSLVAAGEQVRRVTYAVGDHDLNEGHWVTAPAGDRVSVLTGANSGGKTTLLETLCQVTLLARMGLPVPADEAVVSAVDAVVFHRRHASFNAGVLESTLRSIVPPLTDDGRTLMLVDEFEAITEPGSAASLLHGLLALTAERSALGVFVTHLAEDLTPLPEQVRVDGIFAEGLNAELELEVDYQPRFDAVGKSTPEFIVSRLVAEADDEDERAGFRALAGAVGEEAVQRTLADAEWTG